MVIEFILLEVLGSIEKISRMQTPRKQSLESLQAIGRLCSYIANLGWHPFNKEFGSTRLVMFYPEGMWENRMILLLKDFHFIQKL